MPANARGIARKYLWQSASRGEPRRSPVCPVPVNISSSLPPAGLTFVARFVIRINFQRGRRERFRDSEFEFFSVKRRRRPRERTGRIHVSPLAPPYLIRRICEFRLCIQAHAREREREREREKERERTVAGTSTDPRMRSLGPFCLALFSPEKRCDADTLNILVSTLYANETFQSRRAESSLSLSLSLSLPHRKATLLRCLKEKIM